MNKALRGLKLRPASPPGATRSGWRARRSGRSRTAGVSERFGPIALGYVHRAHFAAGAVVQVGERDGAIVVEPPFGLSAAQLEQNPRSPPSVSVKIYTKTGDAGQTGLIDESRVGKDDLRVSAYGDVDELNSVLGVVRGGAEESWPALDALLHDVQRDLFALGAQLADPKERIGEKKPKAAVGGDAQVTRLERAIDEHEAGELPALKAFVLPGGAPDRRPRAPGAGGVPARGARRGAAAPVRGRGPEARRLPEPALRPVVRARAVREPRRQRGEDRWWGFPCAGAFESP